MTCRSWVRWMYSYIDETLPEAQMSVMKAHLQECSACRERYRQEGLFVNLMMEAKDHQVSEARAVAGHLVLKSKRRWQPLGWAMASLLVVLGGLIFLKGPTKNDANALSPQELKVMVQSLYETRRDACADLKYARSDWVRLDKGRKVK